MDMNYRGGMWEGEGGQDGVEGGIWDNCNSIINKYIKKKKTMCFCHTWFHRGNDLDYYKLNCGFQVEK